jgi:hypothetical protein
VTSRSDAPGSHLFTAFRYDEPLRSRAGSFVLRRHAVGELLFPTGRVIACDPLVDPGAAPLDIALPAERGRVELSVAHFDGGPDASPADQRVAFAALRFGDQAVATWTELAGYPVDSGTGGFLDPAAAAALSEWARRDPAWFEVLLAALQSSYVDTWSWVRLEIEGGPHVMAAFSTGFGDGWYPTWAGRDAGGVLACLVTDFGIVDDPALPFEDEPVRPRRWWRFWNR